MSTSMIRIPDDLKEQLEQLKEQYYAKTLYDVIEKLLAATERQKAKISELQQEKEDEKKRREEEYIYLGAELKGELSKLMDDIGIRNPAHAVDFLIENFDGMPNISKLAFMKYAKHMKN